MLPVQTTARFSGALGGRNSACNSAKATPKDIESMSKPDAQKHASGAPAVDRESV
jgi:hypothetical protein